MSGAWKQAEGIRKGERLLKSEEDREAEVEGWERTVLIIQVRIWQFNKPLLNGWNVPGSGLCVGRIQGLY